MNDFIPGAEYKLRRIELRLGSELMGKTGTLKLDDIVRGRTSGVDEARLANMQLTVNDDYIVVSADTWVQGLELLDINGRNVKAAGGNCLNVADVEPGIYLVRVHINGRTITQKVAIK